MSILTPITRIVLLGGVAGVAYAGVIAALPGHSSQITEPGFANPAHVELYKPKNESGRVELYLRYDNGLETVILPILNGPNGPVVGDADYNWGSMLPEKQQQLVTASWTGLDAAVRDTLTQEGWAGLDAAKKSELVSDSWNDLLTDMRKSILTNELGTMLENYGR